jgi:hypothetical protein
VRRQQVAFPKAKPRAARQELSHTRIVKDPIVCAQSLLLSKKDKTNKDKTKKDKTKKDKTKKDKTKKDKTKKDKTKKDRAKKGETDNVRPPCSNPAKSVALRAIEHARFEQQ